MILIAYDGSADAQAAVDYAAALLHGETATVLTVWEPFVERATSSGASIGLAPELVDYGKIDSAYEESAHQRATEGAERAIRGGLNAQPRIRSRTGSVSAAILAEAEEVDARAIVIGSRGLSGLKSVLLGSVSHAVIHHAHRPVILVPSPRAATERRRHH